MRITDIGYARFCSGGGHNKVMTTDDDDDDDVRID